MCGWGRVKGRGNVDGLLLISDLSDDAEIFLLPRSPPSAPAPPVRALAADFFRGAVSPARPAFSTTAIPASLVVDGDDDSPAIPSAWPPAAARPGPSFGGAHMLLGGTFASKASPLGHPAGIITTTALHDSSAGQKAKIPSSTDPVSRPMMPAESIIGGQGRPTGKSSTVGGGVAVAGQVGLPLKQ